jgi:hypothetical protein
MLESMIKSLLSVIKELKTPEGGCIGFLWPGAESTSSNKFFKDFIGRLSHLPAQQESNV